jgi:hypothetical protein
MAKSVSRWWAVLAALFLGVLGRSELAAQDADQAAWQATVEKDTEAAYRAFLNGNPDSPYSDEAFRRLIDLLVAKDDPAFASAFDDTTAEGIVPSAIPY